MELLLTCFSENYIFFIEINAFVHILVAWLLFIKNKTATQQNVQISFNL